MSLWNCFVGISVDFQVWIEVTFSGGIGIAIRYISCSVIAIAIDISIGGLVSESFKVGSSSYVGGRIYFDSYFDSTVFTVAMMITARWLGSSGAMGGNSEVGIGGA
jgi:hypothetical protein